MPSTKHRTSPGQLIAKAGCKKARDIAGRDVAFQLLIETVGDRKIGHGTSQDRGIKYGRCFVDELGLRVTCQNSQTVRETLFELRLKCVVIRVADVVPEETYSSEL